MNDFFKNVGNGVCATVFDESVMFIADGQESACEKPARLALAMNRKQLQTIVDNAELFDETMTSSAKRLLNHYDTLRVDYTE